MTILQELLDKAGGLEELKGRHIPSEDDIELHPTATKMLGRVEQLKSPRSHPKYRLEFNEEFCREKLNDEELKAFFAYQLASIFVSAYEPPSQFNQKNVRETVRLAVRLFPDANAHIGNYSKQHAFIHTAASFDDLGFLSEGWEAKRMHDQGGRSHPHPSSIIFEICKAAQKMDLPIDQKLLQELDTDLQRSIRGKFIPSSLAR